MTNARQELRVPSWTLADRLRKVRRDELGLEQIPFARVLDVTPQAYAAWESGRTTPRDVVALARRIELLTGVPATWLLGLDGSPAGVQTTESCSTPAGQRCVGRRSYRVGRRLRLRRIAVLALAAAA